MLIALIEQLGLGEPFPQERVLRRTDGTGLVGLGELALQERVHQRTAGHGLLGLGCLVPQERVQQRTGGHVDDAQGDQPSGDSCSSLCCRPGRAQEAQPASRVVMPSCGCATCSCARSTRWEVSPNPLRR